MCLLCGKTYHFTSFLLPQQQPQQSQQQQQQLAQTQAPAVPCSQLSGFAGSVVMQLAQAERTSAQQRALVTTVGALASMVDKAKQPRQLDQSK